MSANTLGLIPTQQGRNGRVGDNLITGAGEVPGQLALFEVPLPAAATNGNGQVTQEQVAQEQPGFNGRILARGADRLGRSWVGATLHYATGIGGVACDVIAHTPSVVGATIASVPDMITAVGTGPVDWLAARAYQANADHWTANSAANLGHSSELESRRRAAASDLGSGALHWLVSRFANRSGNKVVENEGRLFDRGFLAPVRPRDVSRAASSAEWANTVDAASRDMAASRSRIAGRYRTAIGRGRTATAQVVAAPEAA